MGFWKSEIFFVSTVTVTLTDVVVTRRAAVITPGGDVIKESIGAFPKVVLSEGEYRAIAKNEGKVYERPFNVVNGVDGEVEVVAR